MLSFVKGIKWSFLKLNKKIVTFDMSNVVITSDDKEIMISNDEFEKMINHYMERKSTIRGN